MGDATIIQLPISVSAGLSSKLLTQYLLQLTLFVCLLAAHPIISKSCCHTCFSNINVIHLLKTCTAAIDIGGLKTATLFNCC